MSSSIAQIPSSIAQIPSSSGQIPSSSGQIPSSSGQIPSSIAQIPSSIAQIPSSIRQIPSSIGQIPSSTGQIPSSIGQIPSSIGQIPSSSGQIPGSSGQSQVESVTPSTQERDTPEQTPSGSSTGQIPNSFGQMPSSNGQIPSSIGQMSSSSGQIPSSSGQMSSSIAQIPSSIGQMSSSSGQIPSSSGQMSSSSGQIPSSSGQIPSSSGQMSSSNDQSQVNYRFVCAGTPTVQFREANPSVNNAGPVRQLIDLETRSFITPSIENAIIDHNRINDFVPEVLPSVLSRPSSSVDDIKEFILQNRENFINMRSEDPLLLEVRREHVLMDAIAIIRYSQEDLHSPLQIKFCGEQGVDVGGLRREFWSLFLYQLSHSIFVTGKEGRLSFQANFMERKKNTFFHLGQLVALSILQDGPGAPIFSECITDYILNGKYDSLDPEDLMEGPKEILEKFEFYDTFKYEDPLVVK
ncbi:SUMO-interacting motif-containing protein 1-like [Saccostrea cucullata]|uniref:SUMO-interacting motif-containing protein 1-like n=1 Tax=Saccostrea cuccullata TaxID=36930 RepID=UPI002ED4C2E0